MLIRNVIFTICCLLTVIKTHAGDEKEIETCSHDNQIYVFSWELSNECDDKPRGGTSKGVEIVFDSSINDGWEKIQMPGLSKKDKDRQAILAMQGPFRVDFDFLETVGFSEGYKRDIPYHSWGTEYVYVLEEDDDFISLQHLMVIYMKKDDGTTSEPYVMKHWRQDWTYEDKSLLIYNGDNTWTNQQVSREIRQGKWSQAVFQVDDSPRYESIGMWEHNPSFSSWVSGKTNRPLPRREFSVRKDYHLLEGINRHTINRYGWVQEEENWKKVLDKYNKNHTYLAKEEGMGRYRRIIETDFTPGDKYLAATEGFWKDVRAVWKEIITKNKTITLHKTFEGKPMFMPLFEYAQKVQDEENYNHKAGKNFILGTVSKYINHKDIKYEQK
jgi:hypothetical protein